MTISTIKKLAETLEISRKTAHVWKKKGMPVEPDGTYDPERITSWRATWDDTVIDDGAGSAENCESLRYWDREFRKFRAKREELEFQVRSGELVPRTQLVDLLVERATEFKRELLGRARRLAARLAHKTSKEVAAALEEDSLQILRKYSR